MTGFRYGFEKRLPGLSYEKAIEKTTEALAKEGFGVLMQIDVKDTLKKKLNVDFRRYMILGACNPPLAHQSLQAEPQLGLLLPCNVVVQEMAPDDVVVSFIDPKALFTLVDKPEVAPVAQEVYDRLQKVAGHLG